MSVIYRIKEWQRVFEGHQERKKLKGKMTWVRIPTAVTIAYRRLMRLPNGPMVYGCFVALVRVASQCEVRGTLARNGRGLTPGELEDLTDIPEEVMSEAMETLASERVGWLEPIPAQIDDQRGDLFNQRGDLPESPRQTGNSAEGARRNGKISAVEREKERKNARAGARGQGGCPPATPGHGAVPPVPPGEAPSGASLGIAMHAPPDLKRSNRAAWHEIAKQHGPQVANRAHEATKARHGAIYLSSQLVATYQAAFRAEALDRAHQDWPTPGAKAPQQGDVPPPSGEIVFAPNIDEEDEFDAMFPPDPGP